MNLQKILALLLGKAIFLLTQTFKIGGGSAAPGYYALKIYPNLVSELAKQIPQTIVITGTNGKTTTARMLAQIIKNSGLKVLRNFTGSNLERGIASALITNYQLLTTNYQPDLAIWELDEAAFNTVMPKLKPNIVVFLNAFRDQLDRYGEVDSVIKKWQQTLKKIDKNTLVILNGDDHNLSKLKEGFTGKVQTFGVKDVKIHGEKVMKQPKQQKFDFEAKNVQPQGLEKINFSLNSQDFTLPVPGTYHIYNFLAAFACAQYLEIPVSIIKKSLENFSPAFGRVEKFEWGYIFLIKNPIGATQVLQTLAQEIKPEDRLLLALNDNLADGTDVSWIWDSNFELLSAISYQLSAICSGTRANDMAVRLKYAGLEPETITVENNIEKAFRGARKGLRGRLFILPTYTALLSLQKILTSSGIKKHYWEEKV